MIPIDARCTGSSARWCPVCGDCTCGPRYEGAGADEERTLDDDGCPLHGASSAHAREPARDVLSLADALATAERERDEARADLATIASALGPEWVSGETHGDTVARLVRYARRASDMVDEIRGRAVESNATLAAERDTARSALDGLTAAVRAERVARRVARLAQSERDALEADAWPDGDDDERAALAAAAERLDTAEIDHDAARDQVTALLSAAPAPTTVPAALVRAYLAASDRYEAAWAPMLAHDGPPLSDEAVAAAIAAPDAEMDAARAALGAALAGCP